MASHSFFLVTLCLVALAGHTAQCRRLSEVAAATAPAPAPVSSSLGANFYAAPAGSKCTDFCPTKGLKPAAFNSIGNLDTRSAACAAKVDNVWVAGYQMTNAAQAVCNVAAGGAAQAAPEYACLCMLEGNIQGLVRSDGSADCPLSCESGFEGYTGIPAQPDTTQMSFACLPYSDLGNGNRLGSVSAGPTAASCTTTDATAVANEAQFSCLCLFRQPAQPLRPAAVPAASAANLGRDNMSVSG